MKRTIYLSFALLLPLTACREGAKNRVNTIDGRLPRAEERHGGFDLAMERYYAAVDSAGIEMHSIMVLRDGKVAAERWWDGHSPDETHRMWSVSKSFTATAIGFAVAEGLLSLDDKVVSFFPDKVPADNPLLSEITVRNLLTMSTGQPKEPPHTGDDWVAEFMAGPVVDAPGTRFRYNSMATFMLSAIIQKVSGQKLFDYLKPRLFTPLEIDGISWDESPQGISAGGWGLNLHTEDMAKFGQLFLQGGVWSGRQILPAGWVDEATTRRMDSGPSGNESLTDPSSDWTQGYCYQMWRCRHNAYRADGAFGQYIIVIPDRDAVVVATANVGDMQSELNLIWAHILPALPQTN